VEPGRQLVPRVPVECRPSCFDHLRGLAGSHLDRVARVLATSAFLLVLIVIAIVLAT